MMVRPSRLLQSDRPQHSHLLSRWLDTRADHDGLSTAGARLRFSAFERPAARARPPHADSRRRKDSPAHVYGWFDRAEHGVYVLTEAGRATLKRWPQNAAMSVLPSFESADAWLGCHINFVLQCNRTLTRYPGSKEGPHESRLDYQVWTSARKALDAQSTRPSLWWASPGLSSHT